MLFRWDKELSGYNFSLVHQINKTMTEVDDLTRRYGKFILQYCIITYILYSKEKNLQTEEYEWSVFTKYNIGKITSATSYQDLKLMLVSNSKI